MEIRPSNRPITSFMTRSKRPFTDSNPKGPEDRGHDRNGPQERGNSTDTPLSSQISTIMVNGKPTRAAQPTRHIFDAWNSSSTGHQTAPNRMSGSTAWRDIRTARWGMQFSKTLGEVVAGDETPKNNECETREDIRDLTQDAEEETKGFDDVPSAQIVSEEPDVEDVVPEKPTPIFRGLVFYINGSTFPTISDHALRRLLVTHGGTLSLGLARRSVTHVVLGHRNGYSTDSLSTTTPTIGPCKGAGGGLAGGKQQREMSRVRGKGVKYVTAEWVLACVSNGKRVSEAGFGAVDLGGTKQRSVRGMFGVTKPNTIAPAKNLEMGT